METMQAAHIKEKIQSGALAAEKLAAIVGADKVVVKPDRFNIEVVQAYLNIKSNPLIIRIGDRQASNTGGIPSVLIPAGDAQ